MHGLPLTTELSTGSTINLETESKLMAGDVSAMGCDGMRCGWWDVMRWDIMRHGVIQWHEINQTKTLWRMMRNDCMRWHELRKYEMKWDEKWWDTMGTDMMWEETRGNPTDVSRFGQDHRKRNDMKWKAMSDKWWERMKNDKIKATRGRECASMGWAAPDPQDYLAEAKATPASYRLFFWILEKGGGER